MVSACGIRNFERLVAAAYRLVCSAQSKEFPESSVKPPHEECHLYFFLSKKTVLSYVARFNALDFSFPGGYFLRLALISDSEGEFSVKVVVSSN